MTSPKETPTKRPSVSRTTSSQSTKSTKSAATSPTSSSPPSKSGLDSSSPAKDGDIIIDMETFQQILELDDDDPTREFSRSTVDEYLDQVNRTVRDMDKAYKEQDLETLSSLGHFLKGSSAALGVKKLQSSCEQMQHVGQLRDETKGEDLTKPEALKMIEAIISRVKIEHKEAEVWLKNYYKKVDGG